MRIFKFLGYICVPIAIIGYIFIVYFDQISPIINANEILIKEFKSTIPINFYITTILCALSLSGLYGKSIFRTSVCCGLMFALLFLLVILHNVIFPNRYSHIAPEERDSLIEIIAGIAIFLYVIPYLVIWVISYAVFRVARKVAIPSAGTSTI